MPIDITVPNSPGWWFARLLVKLDSRREHYDILDGYYRGINAVPVASTKAVRESYQRLMAVSRSNYAELVVEAVRERMRPTGFRTGADADDLGDREAWRIWQANSLDADSAILDSMALSLGLAYTIVGGVDTEIGAPLITIEDPREVVTIADVRRRRRQIAGLKVFHDDVEDVDRAFLYLPGWVIQARRTAPATVPDVEAPVSLEVGGWEWDGPPQQLPYPVVPVIPHAYRPDRAGTPCGEFEPHLSVLDRINYTILGRVEIATLQAFRQRAIKGVPTMNPDGSSVDYSDIFSSDPGAMWHLPETAEIWESQTVDLDPLRTAIRDDIQDLAAVTRTPLFYLTPDAANGSAEGASLAREGLVFKTTDRLNQAGESLEQMMATAFLFAGDTERARRSDMEVIWASPERFSLEARHDANVKAKAGDVPWRTRMSTILQHTPQEIDRMEAERMTDALLAEPVDVDAGF